MPDPTEYVYLIGSRESRLVKIGRSTGVEKRLSDLQRMSPVPLAVLWRVEGGSQLETSLHRRFKAYRSHGEWFDLPNLDVCALVATAVQEIKADNLRTYVERRQASKMGKMRRVFRPSGGAACRSLGSRERAVEERFEDLKWSAGFRVGEVVSITHPSWPGPKTGVLESAGKSDKYIFSVRPNDAQRHRYINLFALSDIAHQADVVELPQQFDVCEAGCYCEAVRLKNFSLAGLSGAAPTENL